jgi:organic radical activating enzyme
MFYCNITYNIVYAQLMMDLERWWSEIRNDSLSRKTYIKKNGVKKYLLANFSETVQAGDIKKSAYVISDWYRTKDNLKVNDGDPDEVLERAVKDQFDMPQWASIALGKSLNETNMTFMPQTKTCNVYCPWCFVDDFNKNGKMGRGEYFSVREGIDVLQELRKEKTIHMMRRSGGEPLLLPWQWTENLIELERRGLSKEIYFQGETNLTTGHFIDFLQRNGRLNKYFWDEVADYENFGVLCSFKGTDVESNLRSIGFSRKDGKVNRNFSFLEKERWYTFDKMVQAGIDAYPFVYDPNPNTLQSFLVKGMKKYGSDFVSKTWVFPLKMYGPEKIRLERRGIDKDEMQMKLDENYRIANEMMRELVPKMTGHEYKAIPRTDVHLKVK